MNEWEVVAIKRTGGLRISLQCEGEEDIYLFEVFNNESLEVLKVDARQALDSCLQRNACGADSIETRWQQAMAEVGAERKPPKLEAVPAPASLVDLGEAQIYQDIINRLLHEADINAVGRYGQGLNYAVGIVTARRDKVLGGKQAS